MSAETQKMDHDPVFGVPVLVILLLILPPSISSVVADPLQLICALEHGNYTSNPPFQSNLKLLLELLSSNTSMTGFYSTFVGDSHNRVYGRALCRGDASSKICQSCVYNATKDIMSRCNSVDALIWYELCQVQYSFQNVSTEMVYTGKYPASNDQERLAPDRDVLLSRVTDLMHHISSEAAYVHPSQMFATGQINYSASKTIYGLAQCTRDISGDLCHNCLMSALGDLKTCCSSREGGIIVSRNCNMRFETSKFYNGSSTSVLSNPATTTGNKWKKLMTVPVTCGLLLAVLAGSCVVYFNRIKARQVSSAGTGQSALVNDLVCVVGVEITEEGALVGTDELPFMDLATIRAATDDFSNSNKLGKGGFGTVYKGVLGNGKEVAVKRLSRKSWQGLEEFKNEVNLIAALQHRNLVRLLGCGVEGDEKLLIYEFMPNRSLDIYIFEPEKRVLLDWRTYQSIIDGIAGGLVYLHEDSRLRIIHRDLKPSNVLLDHEMVAKISDFGMARIFCEKQSIANTRRVVGTYGYMAPEYAMGGYFSVKSDVFSYGVILLEIISGKRNSGFYLTEHAKTLLAYAWHLWEEGKELELVDPSLVESGLATEIIRCIHIGLLCVQEDPADRPTMSEVVALLRSDAATPPKPKQPAFSVGRVPNEYDEASESAGSSNGLTVSSVLAR